MTPTRTTTKNVAMNNIFNFTNTMIINKQPDSDAIFGNFFRMLSLATSDPEGCVRLRPDMDMNAQDFADYFHCQPDEVNKSITLLQKLNLISVKDGLIKVTVWDPKPTAGQHAGLPDTNYRPAKPGMIPLEHLPVEHQRILGCWNKLPLIKMTGLYPALKSQLDYMLQFYGEKSIIDAICIISHCPFLLNQAENSTGWFITFKWMLEDSHFESILAGDYLDRDDPLKAKLQGEYEEGNVEQ